MKQLIIFSILTACMMSFAQMQNESASASDRAVVVFTNSKLNTKIWVIHSDPKKIADQVDLKPRVDNYKSLNKAQIPQIQNGVRETLVGGGWHPELTEVAKNASGVSGFLSEVSRSLGAKCRALDLAAALDETNFDFNLVLELDQLSQETQNCLRM